LYDVAYYGTSIFMPQILEAIFGGQSKDLTEEAWQAAMVSAVGIPVGLGLRPQLQGLIAAILTKP
jgi:hypothetical protein